MRQPEEAEHGEVDLAVAGVRRRVDEVDRVRGPQAVAAPQVAVQPGGGLLGDQVGEPADDCLDRGGVVVTDRARSRASLR